MRSADAEKVADLATQLGYPSSTFQVARRFGQLDGQADHGLFAAESDSGEVIGWIHVHGRQFLESDPFVEIGGLVVDEHNRGRGVGRALVAAAEHWAENAGYSMICVRSNAVRTEAHKFYERAGYDRIKLQQVFRKTLGTGGAKGWAVDEWPDGPLA